MNVKFEAEVDDGIMDEIRFWGLKLEDVICDAMEHSLRGSIRRSTDNLCRECKKPIKSSVPPQDRVRKAYPTGFCECRPH